MRVKDLNNLILSLMGNRLEIQTLLMSCQIAKIQEKRADFSFFQGILQDLPDIPFGIDL